MRKYIASVSFGKDSLAMLLYILENKLPLDEVVFYDTGMEFQAIYDVRNKVLPILQDAGVTYTELHPKNPFIYDMLHRPKTKRTGEKVNGDGWCGGPCRWGTFHKQRALNQHCGQATVYIGLAADEQRRLANLEENKKSPIAEAGMTEKECLMFCRAHGFSWKENAVDLYEILDRVSCWCCANKNLKELYNIYVYLPHYWTKLKALQCAISRPYRRDGKTIDDLEEIFYRKHLCELQSKRNHESEG